MKSRKKHGWIEPHAYSTRSFSLDEGIIQPITTSGTTIDDPVAIGLMLAGSGLNTKGSHNKSGPYSSKARNFSANDIERFDINSQSANSSGDENPPSPAIVEARFNELLQNKAFFWGSARKGLQNLSNRRKWQLVCKEQKLRSHADRIETPSSTIELFNAMKMKLTSQKDLSAPLYHLERLLRQNEFCQVFLKNDGVEFLAKLSDNISDQTIYVFLRCFKTLMNHDEGRAAILICDRLVSYLCFALTTEEISLRVRVLSTEMLLLLTYVDDHDGRNVVVNHMSNFYGQWFSLVRSTLSDPENVSTQNEVIIIPKPQQMLCDYSLTTLFLINSIVQVSATLKEKREFINTFKEYDIHKMFRQMQLQDFQPIQEEIEKYTSIEDELLSQSNSES